MVQKFMTAAAIGAMITGSAIAETPSDKVNLGMMHWIRDTVCTQDREIVFVPVSHDVPTLSGEWAVIAMDNPDPDSAHIVTLTEKNWLKANGCDEDPSPQMHMASREPESGRLGL
ncbi:hypothetical protein [Hyphomonas sp.]|jgi:hypothetical protein|uniref:hypothetical protein n=1 Tax=Hyphomonas sp. TaxID=87 RepID=UPI002623040C|nr:hypothetical protein [Hyphomonas sp.]MDF1806632.1 hypothetical protein [Hyphomonas sp.]